jgi:hypothetical protein
MKRKSGQARKPNEIMGLLCEELDKWSVLIVRFAIVTHGLFYALKLLLIR